jgi:hypothetical protein
MLERRRTVQTIWLLVGDWLALGLFVLLGQIDHDLLALYGLSRLLLTTVELALPWTVVAVLLGAYWVAPDKGQWRFLGRTLNAWLVAAPLALLLRAWLHGQATIIVIFFALTLGLAGAFLLVWRWLFYRVVLFRRAGYS